MLLDEYVTQITRSLNSETHSWCPACGAFPLHVFYPSGFTLHFSSITRNCQPLPDSAAICALQRAQVLRVLLLVIPAQFPAYTAKVRPPGPPTRRQQRATGQQRRHWPAAPHDPAAAPDRPLHLTHKHPPGPGHRQPRWHHPRSTAACDGLTADIFQKNAWVKTCKNRQKFAKISKSNRKNNEFNRKFNKINGFTYKTY